MKLAKALGLGVLVIVAAATRAAGEADFDRLMRELKGEAPAPERPPAELVSAYATVLVGLLPKMGSDNMGDQGWAKDTWQDVCWRAGRPGAAKEREAASKVTASKLASANVTARAWLVKQLEHIGGDEAVDALSACLADPDAMIRERARRALMKNPSDSVAESLRGALAKADAPAWRAALVNALDGRDDRTTIATLRRLARDPDDAVRTAAVRVLAGIGSSAARLDIAAARTKGPEQARRAATDAYLLLADRFAASDRRPMAVRIYKELLGAGGHVKCAAIIGLGRAGGAAELDVILEAVADQDAKIAGAGRDALAVMPLETLRRAAAERYEGASAGFKAGMLEILARRADTGSVRLFIAAASDADAGVRLAALSGLARAGDASAVPVLAKAAAKGEPPEREAARRSLKLVSGPGIDEAMIAHLAKADASERVELIAALADRRASEAVDALLGQARDADGTVGAEALKALAVLAGEESLGDLVGLLVKAADDRVRREAEKAVVATCRRVEDVERRSGPVLSALGGAAGDARASLLRVLGRIGGRRPLVSVRDALADADDAIVDAAVRALGDWPDGSAAGDLLELAGSAKQETHRILALRGFARVVGLPSDRPADETTGLFLKGIRLATRPDEKKLMLAGLGEVMQPGALDAVATYLEDQGLQAEAGAAMVRIARGIGGQDTDRAKAALSRVIAECRDDNVKNDARETMNLIERYEDYITAWQVSGPYVEAGKQVGELIDHEFPPEKPGAEEVKWKLATAGTNPGLPFLIELDKILGGENRVGYLRVQVSSPKDQEATLEIGSDDGVKVWLNGEVVHKNNAFRPAAPGQDKAKARLREGWNPMLVKITQGGGQWAFCARFRAPDGSHLEGLRTRIGDDR